MEREFASGRREFPFPTVAIRGSLLQTFGVQVHQINPMLSKNSNGME